MAEASPIRRIGVSLLKGTAGEVVDCGEARQHPGIQNKRILSPSHCDRAQYLTGDVDKPNLTLIIVQPCACQAPAPCPSPGSSVPSVNSLLFSSLPTSHFSLLTSTSLPPLAFSPSAPGSPIRSVPRLTCFPIDQVREAVFCLLFLLRLVSSARPTGFCAVPWALTAPYF